MAPRFAPIEPHDYGRLKVGDGHAVYWESCGNPQGVPCVFLHGGPGSGCAPRHRQLFDPRRFRAILFDQRGSGRSLPRAEEPEHILATNTTDRLIADIESLRRHLGVDRWIVVGFSWGSTLGLAYAEAHPEAVAALVLGAVATTSRREVDWITVGVSRFFPEAWARFVGAIPERLAGMRPVDAYAEMLADEDPDLRAHAAREWCTWEDTHVSLAPGHRPNPSYLDPAFRLRFATLVTHYWRNDGFRKNGALVRDARLLDGIPGALIHGRLDVSSPVETAWELAARWPAGRLEILDDVGHGGVALTAAVVDALDDLG